MNLSLRKLCRTGSALLCVLGLQCLFSCSRSHTALAWREEVRLLDGRTITIGQKRNCEPGYTGNVAGDCISRETWVTLDLPEFSSGQILWHENLFAIVINVYAGNLYVVGYPTLSQELVKYGNPKPPYVGYIWRKDHWERIPFAQIPTQIYETNVFTGNMPVEGNHLTVAQKESDALGMRGNPRTVKFLNRIDPSL